MNTAIMWIMALGALIGGLDCALGNRLGLGEKFENGFHVLGSTALCMAGIICLAPALSSVLRSVVAPLCAATGVDPAIFGGILAIDMGGYPLAMELAGDVRMGRYAGILVASVFGCTITFTIPVGMGVVEEADKGSFARGILFGLIAMPAALLAGGLLCGMGLWETVKQNLPILTLAGLLLLGIWKIPGPMLRGFGAFARGIRIVTTLGLAAGAFTYMTGVELIPGMEALEDAMAVVSSIGIVMLGSLPVAELIQRALKRPLEWVGRHTGMNTVSVAGLLVGMVSVLPAILMVKDMDERGKVVNAAFFVSAASMLAAHLGFTAASEPEMVGMLLAVKLAGGTVGALIALAATRKRSAASAAE